MDDGSKMAPGVFAGIVRERLARDEGAAAERARVRAILDSEELRRAIMGANVVTDDETTDRLLAALRSRLGLEG